MADELGEDQEPSAQDRIARLEKRLARERAARVEAESIADRGMRELWFANRELDERVAERTADLERALSDLQVASSARDQLLRNMSHEVKTPLNGIRGSLDLLREYVEHTDGADYWRAAEVSAERLDSLLSRLLTMVEVASGRLQLQLEPTPLTTLAGVVRDKWERKGMKLGYLVLTVCLTGDDEVNAVGTGSPQSPVLDREKVLQLVDTLVCVIIESSTPCAIQIEFESVEDSVQVSVSADVDDVDVAAIRSRSSDMVSAVAGTTLTRQVVELMGGTLDVGVDETNSSAFRFLITLPTSADQHQRAAPDSIDEKSTNYTEPEAVDVTT